MRILTVNTGSTSLKLERYAFDGATPAIAEPPGPEYAAEPAVGDAASALATALGDGVDAVAHRFVRMPDGEAPVLALDAAAIERIRLVAREAPLHDTAALDAVATVERVRPGVAQYAVSDSAFHRTLSPEAATYALPREHTRAGVRRIGYHGLSHEYAAHRGCMLAGLDLERVSVITAHLGGGSSLCAVQGGRSIDTTMGYTPLEGLPMATRSGSIDPGVIVHLLRGGMSVDALAEMLERASGLLGISGRSGDVRELLAADDADARLALAVLVWRLRAALGAASGVLGGADLIVFTGGIGEHAATIRSSALTNGLGFGVKLDAARNTAGGEGRIDAADSRVAVAIVHAREGWQLARAVYTREAR